MKNTIPYAGQNIAYWTKRAPGYSSVNQEELRTGQRRVWSHALDSRIQEHFPNRLRESIRVLDVGTGPGFFAIVLTLLGYQVTAVDYTPAMLDQARKNAGNLAEQINFLAMNAEELTFPDNSFDVVVSRNLTWNLHAPHKAYEQWSRVLKPGGLLLNFDANWYRYLYDDRAKAQHQTDRENVRLTGAEDDTAGTDVTAMEEIARQAPLSLHIRPAWDLETLAGFGMEASADPEVWKQVWTQDEWVNNASTPMFLICAEKPAHIGVNAS